MRDEPVTHKTNSDLSWRHTILYAHFPGHHSQYHPSPLRATITINAFCLLQTPLVRRVPGRLCDSSMPRFVDYLSPSPSCTTWHVQMSHKHWELLTNISKHRFGECCLSGSKQTKRLNAFTNAFYNHRRILHQDRKPLAEAAHQWRTSFGRSHTSWSHDRIDPTVLSTMRWDRDSARTAIQPTRMPTTVKYNWLQHGRIYN